MKFTIRPDFRTIFLSQYRFGSSNASASTASVCVPRQQQPSASKKRPLASRDTGVLRWPVSGFLATQEAEQRQRSGRGPYQARQTGYGSPHPNRLALRLVQAPIRTPADVCSILGQRQYVVRLRWRGHG